MNWLKGEMETHYARYLHFYLVGCFLALFSFPVASSILNHLLNSHVWLTDTKKELLLYQRTVSRPTLSKKVFWLAQIKDAKAV